MKKSPDWHFARPALATTYLDYLELGLSSARALFARRRMGKTEFLVRDLIPAARKRGYLTAYANFWDDKRDPARVLVEALHSAVEPTGMGKVLQSLNSPVKKLKAGGKLAGLGEASIEAEIGESRQRTARNTELATAMRAVDKGGKPLLLVLDEAQVLAKAGDADFAHALRAALDVRKDTIKVVFAGSSESTLRLMFAKSSEPFFNWAPLEAFPLLDSDFVEFMVERTNERTTQPIAVADALRAYDALHRTPEFLRRFVEQYLINPFDGADAALCYTKDHVFTDGQFQHQWNGLLPADREVLVLMNEGVRDLHGKGALARIAKALGLENPVGLSTAQNSLTRLQKANIVTRIDRGHYQFEDEAFAEWLALQREA